MSNNIIAPNTGTGDYGLSSIINSTACYKDEIVFNLLGDLDEACSAIGVARAVIIDNDVKTLLKNIQTDLIMFSANVAFNLQKDRFCSKKIVELEDIISKYTEYRGTSTDWKIPGDSISDSFLHNARAIVRRAERNMVHFIRENNLTYDFEVAWLNRLSDVLYLLAIYVKD